MELVRLIKSILDTNPKEEQQIILPIDMINEMPVLAKITINPNLVNYLFFVEINANGVELDDECFNFICKFFYEVPITNPVIDPEEFIHTFKKIMNSLRFDKEKGTIEDGEETEVQFFKELITNPNITFKELDQCSVCLENTKTKTPCSHPLCYPCWAKLKTKNCPLCREEIQ
jgi:hypothetical protein